MGRLANVITFTRIAAALFLLSAEPLSARFFILYGWCGISDVLDGWLARRVGKDSPAGAVLDSAADMVFLAAAAIKLAEILLQLLPVWCLFSCAVIAAVRIMAYAAGYFRFRCLAALHTYANKATGIALFFLPFLLSESCRTFLPFAAGGLCILAFVSAAEELVCVMQMKEYNPDISSIKEIK